VSNGEEVDKSTSVSATDAGSDAVTVDTELAAVTTAKVKGLLKRRKVS